jgi:WD40 repeat protein
MPEPTLKRVEELFHHAVALPPEQRPTYLHDACGDDVHLRDAVEVLLRQDAGGLLISPIVREPDAPGPDATTLEAPGPSAPRPGAALPQVPGYEMLRVLGRGGMGVVYLAKHEGLKRLVALKMLAAGRATPEQVDRFRREAEALARLQHPNVVPVYDVGVFDDHLFYTMEYIAGPDLAQLLAVRHPDAHASARLVETLARAAHAVHQCGIVHRDLKPANVLLQAPGLIAGEFTLPKITDFGIAMDLWADRRLTQPGVLMGTPSYMAPEQVRLAREGVGPAADVYGLGSILYELLTGRPPFDAPTPVATLGLVASEEPLSPSRLRPKLPADVVTICLKCLEKSPHRRYASALDLADDLHRFLAREPIRARPVGSLGRTVRWCQRKPVVAGLFALLTLMAVSFVATVVVYDALLSRRVAEERFQIVQLNIVLASSAEASGDGYTAVLRLAEALRFEEEGGGDGREIRRQIAAALRQCPRLLRQDVHPGPVLFTSLTASGQWAATGGADGALQVWDAATARALGPALHHDATVVEGAVSEDGRLVVTVADGGKVRLWDLSSGKSHVLAVSGEKTVRRVAFPAGGRVLLTEHGARIIRLWTATTEEPAPLPHPWTDDDPCMALSEDARSLFGQDGASVPHVWDLTSAELVGTPLPREQSMTLAAVSADGHRVAMMGADGSLRVWHAGEGLGRPMWPRGGVSHMTFSPDGTRVVTWGRGQPIQAWCNGGGDAVEMPMPDNGAGAYVRFSPDSRLLLVIDEQKAQAWDLVEGRPITPPLRHGAALLAATFLADGRQVLTVGRGGTVRVWELPPSNEGGGWDDMSWTELLAWAQLHACARINRDQHQESLGEAELQSAWSALGKDHVR